MHKVQADVLELSRNLLLENKVCVWIEHFFLVLQSECCNTHTHKYEQLIQSNSPRFPWLTDLAYFLEVELRQGVEPVGQLSEVEKLHLKPGKEIQTESRRKCKSVQFTQLPQ